MSSPSEKKPQVLVANIQPKTWSFLNSLMQELNCYEIKTVDNIEKFAENTPTDVNPALIIVDGQSEVAQAAEAVQTLKMLYSSTPLLVLHGPSAPIDFALFRKNGADRLIHFHYDREIIGDLILELAPVDFGANIPLAALSPINFKEIHPEMETNFDIFVHLPTNQKTILLRKKGSLIEEEKMHKIEEAKQHVYFKKTETKQFLEYARTALTMRDSDQVVALTEKLIKSKKVIFDIMSEFFNSQTNNFDIGKSILERCRQIINEYNLLKPKTPTEAYDQIYQMSGQPRSFYHDAIYVCNFSALLGHILSLKTEDIETLALAGLLHNIGLSDVLDYTPGCNVENLTGEALKQYHAYPERSVFMVKSQRVPLSPEVSTTISQHCELSNGHGFPNQLKSDQIQPLAKIMQIAIRIYKMTSITNEQPKFTFKAAMEELKSELKSGQSPHDMVTLMNIFKVLKI